VNVLKALLEKAVNVLVQSRVSELEGISDSEVVAVGFKLVVILSLLVNEGRSEQLELHGALGVRVVHTDVVGGAKLLLELAFDVRKGLHEVIHCVLL